MYDFWDHASDEGDFEVIPLIDGVHVTTDRMHPTIPVIYPSLKDEASCFFTHT